MTYEEFKEKYDIRSDRLESSTWSLGGSWADCWGNTGTVSPEPQPQSFEEFDQLIERICPTMSFIHYKNIYNYCVDTETGSESDYYGGRTHYGYYECDVKRLYEALDERNLIE